MELARERAAPVAIDIRRGGQQLFHAALPGSTPDNDAWIDRKRRVVERYGASSYLVGARFRAKGTTFEESSRLDPDTYAAHGGSFPITVEGAGVIGTVTVSGLPQAGGPRAGGGGPGAVHGDVLGELGQGRAAPGNCATADAVATRPRAAARSRTSGALTRP